MENLLWDVEFDGEAKKDGKIIVKIRLEGPIGFDTDLAHVVPIRKGMTPEEKAEAVVAALQARYPGRFDYEFSPPDDDFKLRVRDPDQNARAIKKMSIGDDGTGEGMEAVRDDPGRRPVLTTAFFSVQGKGEVKDGVAQVQIGGDYPVVEVATFGRGGSEIMLELIEAFNEAYARLGFRAEELPGVPGMGIEKVPCPLGIRAGTTDTGLIPERGLAATDR
jgi:hypothetical protein